MNIVKAYPPMIDLIDQTFKVRGKPVIYCWGNTIYNPFSIKVSPDLHEHECVHAQQQQNGGPELWWLRYITEVQFRLAQEIPAHRAEYRELLRMNGDNRNNRRRYLVHVAVRLAAPLYGPMITAAKAKKAIAQDSGTIIDRQWETTV